MELPQPRRAKLLREDGVGLTIRTTVLAGSLLALGHLMSLTSVREAALCGLASPRDPDFNSGPKWRATGWARPSKPLELCRPEPAEAGRGGSCTRCRGATGWLVLSLTPRRVAPRLNLKFHFIWWGTQLEAVALDDSQGRAVPGARCRAITGSQLCWVHRTAPTVDLEGSN